MASADALRTDLGEAQGTLRAAMQAVVANWERQPSGSADGEEAWSARQAAEHVVGAELFFAGTVCKSCGYAKPVNPLSDGAISLPTPSAAVEMLDHAIAATTPAIRQISDTDLATTHERMGTVENAMKIWIGHVRDHANQIQTACQ